MDAVFLESMISSQLGERIYLIAAIGSRPKAPEQQHNSTSNTEPYPPRAIPKP
jgi:hypothetical protein